MSKGQADNLSELLSAYLDGELDDAGCAKVVASLERDPAAVQLLSELREAQGLLRDLPREPAPPDMVSGVVAAVERQALLGTAGDQSSKRVRRNLWRPIRAAAAIVLLVGGAGAYIFWQISEQRDVQLATVIRPAAENGLAEEFGADGLTGGELALVDRAPDSNEGLRRKKGGDGSRTSPGRLLVEPTAKPELSRARSAGEQAEQTSADTVASTEGWGFDETQVVMLEPNLADDSSRSENSRVGQDPPFNSRETGGSRPTLRAIQFGLVGRLGAPSGGRVTTTDFASRLGAAEPAEALSGHAFSNESTVLTLNFETHAQREQFSGAVDHYLLANAFLDVADPIQRGQVTRPEEQNVFLRGNAGVNYAETESQQVLLNAPVEAMTALIDQYTQIVPQPARPAGVDLQIGEIQVQGAEQARAVARALVTPEVRRKILGGDDRAADLGNQVAYGVADDRTAEQWQQTYEQFGPTTQQKLGLPGNQVEQMEYANSDEKPEAAKAPRAERQEQDEVGQVARGQVMWADQPTGKADQLSVHRERELQSPQPAEAIGDKDGQIAHKKAKRRARKGGVKGDDEGVLFGARGSGSAGSPMPADELQQVPAENAQQLRRPVTIQDDKDARSQLQRFGNLTFILKLNIVPPAELQGPPAPIPPQSQPATRDTED